MRGRRVLIVTKAEVQERLVGYFGDLISQDYNELARFMREGTLPNFKEMTVGDLADLAQECDLFRSVQETDHPYCNLVMMEDEGGQFYRISAPERDKEDEEEVEQFADPQD